MKKRALTSLIIFLAVALAFVLKILVSGGEYLFDVLIVATACVAAWEMAKLLKGMDKPCYKYLALFFPILIYINHLLGFLFDEQIGLGWIIAIDFSLVVLCFGIAYLVGLASVRALQKEIRIKKLDKTPVRLAFDKAFNSMIALIYPTFLLMFMTIINHLGAFTSTFAGMAAQDGNYLSLCALLLMFVIPAATDVFAYLVGNLFGGKKLCPKISPSKTISGAIGGLVACVLISLCSFLVLNAIPEINVAFSTLGLQIWQVAIIAFVGSIVAQLGDLFESFLKRRAGVKDSGKVLPGHGGVLDRTDSYIFVAPMLLLSFCIILLII